MKAAPFKWLIHHRPEVVRAGRFPMLEGSCGFVYRASTAALHQHDYEGALHVGGRRYDLRPGDVTLTPADVDSHYGLRRDGYHLCIHFETVAAAGRAQSTDLRLPLHFRPGTSANAVRQRIWSIIDLHRRAGHSDLRKRTLALAAASAGLQELLLTLALLEPDNFAAEPASSRVENAVRALIELIETRLDRVLAIPELAREAGLSQNYLARVFRRRYGLTIPRFILLRRGELARHLLTTSQVTVKQVAHKVGLPDVQHFNKQFRWLTGMSPSAYRSAQRGVRNAE